jgi:hypothetical protein
MAAEIAEKPRHKISELTTYELRDYRRELARPGSPAQATIRTHLAAIDAELARRGGQHT